MHLVVTTAFLSISLVLALTPVKGHSIAAHVWEWIKNLFHKKSGSSRIWFSIRTKKIEVLYSSQQAAAPQDLVESPATNLLKQFPPALGGSCTTPPHLSPDWVQAPRLLPPPPAPSQQSVSAPEPVGEPINLRSASKKPRAHTHCQRLNRGTHTPRKMRRPRRRREYRRPVRKRR